MLIVALVLSLPIHAQLYMTKGNMFHMAFTEPFEIMYIVFYNGDMYGFTTHDANKVTVSINYIKDLLNKDGKKIKNIAIIIHNHFALPFFSERDIKTFYYLKRHGFEGAFLIYVQGTRKIMGHRDSKVEFKKEFMEWLLSEKVQEFFRLYKEQYPEAHQELLEFLKEQIK